MVKIISRESILKSVELAGFYCVRSHMVHKRSTFKLLNSMVDEGILEMYHTDGSKYYYRLVKSLYVNDVKINPVDLQKLTDTLNNANKSKIVRKKPCKVSEKVTKNQPIEDECIVSEKLVASFADIKSTVAVLANYEPQQYVVLEDINECNPITTATLKQNKRAKKFGIKYGVKYRTLEEVNQAFWDGEIDLKTALKLREDFKVVKKCKK